MALDGILYLSVGANLVQLGLFIHERRLRLYEKERFAKYIKATDKRLNQLERKGR